MSLQIAGIVKESTVDGPGIRLVVFVQGCDKCCPHCQNKHTWNYDGGKKMDIEEILKEIENDHLIDGVSFSGGEPFDQPIELAKLAIKVHDKGLKIITWSGYTYEEIMSKPERTILLQNIDYLVDGRYVEEKKNLLLKWRGSSNQRLIDVQESLRQNHVVVVEDFSL